MQNGNRPDRCDLPPGIDSPVLKSKYIRVFPDKIKELDQYDYVIYIDGNCRIENRDLIKDLFEKFNCQEFDLSLSLHPRRNCVYDEAQFCLNMEKYNNTDLTSQIKAYKKEGGPVQFGLFWSGFIVYRKTGYARLKEFQDLWWKEILNYKLHENYFPQCQISLSFALWKTGLKFNILPQLRFNGISVHPHGSNVNETKVNN